VKRRRHLAALPRKADSDEETAPEALFVLDVAIGFLQFVGELKGN